MGVEFVKAYLPEYSSANTCMGNPVLKIQATKDEA